MRTEASCGSSLTTQRAQRNQPRLQALAREAWEELLAKLANVDEVVHAVDGV